MRSQNIVLRKVFSNFQFVFQSVMLPFFLCVRSVRGRRKVSSAQQDAVIIRSANDFLFVQVVR